MGHKRVQTRVDDELKERIETYQEEGNYLNQAEAVRSLLRDGLAANEPDEPDELEQTIEDEMAEAEPVPDGGYLRRSDHPWIDPVVNFGYDTARIGLYSMLVALIGYLIPSTAINWFGVDLSAETLALFLSVVLLAAIVGTVMMAVSVLALAALEYLMHPSEGPIRRYFWTPEDDTQEATA